MNFTQNKGSLLKLGIFIMAIIICVVGVSIAFKYVGEKKAINTETKVQNALENIKVAERTRVDSLQALADSTKSYTKTEERIHTQIAAARKNIEDANFEEANLNINSAIKIIQEAYPNLESSDLYKQYNNEVTICNRNIEEARKSYNKVLREYENLIRDPFWRGIIAKTGYEKVEFVKLSETLGDNQDMPKINWD